MNGYCPNGRIGYWSCGEDEVDYHGDSRTLERRGNVRLQNSNPAQGILSAMGIFRQFSTVKDTRDMLETDRNDTKTSRLADGRSTRDKLQ